MHIPFRKVGPGNKVLAELRAKLGVEHKDVYNIGKLNAEIANCERALAGRQPAVQAKLAKPSDPLTAIERAETIRAAATATAAPAQPAPKVEPPKKNLVLVAAAAVYGEPAVQSLVSEHGEKGAIARLERRMYHAHLRIPGHTPGAFATAFERKALFGLQRIERDAAQGRIDAAIGE